MFVNSAQRRMELFRILQNQITVEVNDLSERLGVSTMTIRRDLALFEKQGLVVTNYGGAYLLNNGAGIEPSFALKQGQMTEIKQFIAREAAELIGDGDTVVLDCGTTPLHILKFIQKKKITIITNSWPVVNFVQGNPKIKLILAPGEYNDITAGVISEMTIDFYRKFYADIVFISTQGFSLEHGATVPDMVDAYVKEAILKSAKKKVLMVDHSKIEKNYLVKHAETSDFDVIITDDQVEPGYIDKLRGICGEVIIAGSSEKPDGV
jgi:DeoR family fructose operon transcriptional repressor